ncbi:MAG: NAD-binding protein [Halovenus sp.]
MQTIKRRAIYYVVSIAVLVVVASVAYDIAMKTFEPGQYPPPETDISLLHSMQVVVETFTATGYGSDSPWQSKELNIMVMLLDITGVGLFFVALPAVVLPLFREALSESAPTTVDEDLRDHVVICTFSDRVETLIDELASHDVEYVLVEPDEKRAVSLQRQGHQVVHGDPASIADLERVNIPTARALVADMTDQADASVVLAAKEIDETVRVVSVVEDADLESYHRLAGADVVTTPRKVLAESLANKLTTTVTTDLGDAIEVGEDFDIVELPIQHGSQLHGQTLGDSGIREKYGVNVIGAWFQGDFESLPPPEAVLESGSVLLVTGKESQLERLQQSALSTVRNARRDDAIIVGYGVVGRTIAGLLEDAGLPYTVVDERGMPGVDVVADGTDPDTLREAGVADASSVVLALPDETSTEFATLVARDLNASAEIIARADDANAVRKTYRAGADYVLSLSAVTGRSIADALLEREAILAIRSGVEVIRTTAPGLAGETLESADVRERTGCVVVAVERNGSLLTDLGPGTRIEAGDELIVAGTDTGANRFVELFG